MKNVTQSQTLVDNWTLQEVAELISNGINNNRYTYSSFFSKESLEIPYAALQIDALFGVLTDMIIRDQQLVDEDWEYAWRNKSKPLDYLKKKEIIKTFSFNRSNIFFEYKDDIIKTFNLPSPVQDRFEENIEYWSKYKRNKYNDIAIIISGAAGYLTRSQMLSLSYSPHPLRNDFLLTTQYSGNPSAISQVNRFVYNERLHILKSISQNYEFIIGKLALEPLIIQIIESANSIPNMFTVANEMREHYTGFRKKLANFQAALDNGDFEEISKHKRILDEISSKNRKDMQFGEIELALGFGLINIKLKNNIDIIGKIKDQFGVRSTLKNLIFTKSKEGTFDKFFGFFGENSQTMRTEIKNYFKAKKQKW